MGDLGIVQSPPFGEELAVPVLQWAHVVESPGGGPLQVQLENGSAPRVRQFIRQELSNGTGVRVGRGGSLGVVLDSADEGRTYRVRTARGVLRGVPSGELWPLLSSAPAPGAIDGVLSTLSTGLRSDSSARLRLLWALERFLAICERDGLGGATWVDVSLLPHQIAAVEQVLTSPSIRHLLTDEVGLGKTIEAIMIWSALRAQDPQLCSLVAAPRALVPQWCFEFQRRAERRVKGGWYEGLPRILVADTEGVHDVLDAAEPGRPIVTDHAALEAVTELPLDLLVIDESHLLNRKQRDAADKLAARVKHLLLLTGTPRDARRRTGARARSRTDELSPYLWALQLVDPKLGADQEPASVARSLEDALELGATAREAMGGDLAAIAKFTARASQLLPHDASATTATVPDLVRSLARRSTVFERVVRTQRRHVAGDILYERILARTHVEPREEELCVLRDVVALTVDEAEALVSGEERMRRHAASSWKALSALRVAPPIRAGLGALAGIDSKIDALCDVLGEIWNKDPTRKVVLRAHYADTRRLIFDRVRSLLLDGGLRESHDEELAAWVEDDSIGPVALLQDSNDSIIDLLRRFSPASTRRASEVERLSDVDLRSTMLAQLRSFESFKVGAACLLVANDVAGTGLNLQFASDLIFYDVPWRPQVAEQWIGRLDRLGRRGTNPVRIHVLSHPSSPDWQLIELYESLGVFGEGFRLPPEVATEVDKLIDRADAGHIRWGQAIAEARVLLEKSDAGDNDDVLLDARAPDLVSGRVLAERAFDNGTGSDALNVLMGLKELGFGIEPTPGEQVVRLTMVGDQLALREVRQVLRPPQGRQRPGKGRDPMAAAPCLDVDLRRLPFGTMLRPHASQFFSPQHPVLVEIRQELELNAGGRFGVFELQTPSGLESLAGSWIACSLTRTFPGSAAKAAMWDSGAMTGLDDPELVRVCEIVEAGLARTLGFVFPPSVQSGGRIVAMEAGRLRLTNRDLSEAHVDVLLRALANARPSPQVPAGAETVIEELARIASEFTAPTTSDLSAYQLDREAFLSHRRRDVIGRREKTASEWTSRTKKAGGNIGFEKKAEEEQGSVRRAELVFDHLERFAADQTKIAREATRPRLVVTALVFLKGAMR